METLSLIIQKKLKKQKLKEKGFQSINNFSILDYY